MTQAQLHLQIFDLQTQLEQTPSDLTTHSLFNDPPILFLESLDQVHAHASEQVEQREHNTASSEDQTPPDNSYETPPPPKKKYEIMKDPIFLSSPIYPPILPSKPSLSTNRDDHIIPILSHNRFYMHPTDYTFR